MSPVEDLRDEVLKFIRAGVETPMDDQRFERLAHRVFEYQFEENEPYRRFCERRGIDPGGVAQYADIPVVPTAAFKEAALYCGDVQAAEAAFRTSGTSRGHERRGVHYVRDLELYRTSALGNFQSHLLPDGAKLPMLILAPGPRLAPDSSLTWMLELVRREVGGRGSDYYMDEDGLRWEALETALEEGRSLGQPVAVLGTAAAIARALEALAARGRSIPLPLGSRIMETGGFKGVDREIPRDDFYAMLTERFGVPEVYCVAEYGMTEMCSQFYDNVLREAARGHPPLRRYKVVPPWVRTHVVDAETLEPLPEGRVGVLRHFDLANLHSVMAIQTDDLGVAGPGGFEILGRAEGSEMRGCSIAMDEWLSTQA